MAQTQNKDFKQKNTMNKLMESFGFVFKLFFYQKYTWLKNGIYQALQKKNQDIVNTKVLKPSLG